MSVTCTATGTCIETYRDGHIYDKTGTGTFVTKPGPAICGILVSKFVNTFAQETYEIAPKTSFYDCALSECSRNEFLPMLTKGVLTKRVFAFDHETSFHATSFFALVTKRIFTTAIETSIDW